MRKEFIDIVESKILQPTMELVITEYKPLQAMPKSVWRIPNLNKDKEIRKMNKFLSRMQSRVSKGDIKLAEKLFQSSKSLRLLSFHRAEPGWFGKYEGHELRQQLKTFVRAVTSLSPYLEVYRSYIPKNNNKGRPIGSPALGSKAVLRQLELIARELIEGRIGDYQHGFIRGKGCQSATRAVIHNLRSNKQVYQFDLDGFFNNVNPRGLNTWLRKSLGRGIADYILSITDLTIPKGKELKPEKELVELPDGSILKGGYTQGSPLSPLLSIFALEMAEFSKIDGLVMYADDGIILSEERNEGLKLGVKAKVLGIKIAEDKVNGGVDEEFTFLGLTYNVLKKTIRSDKLECSYLEDSKVLDAVIGHAKYGNEEDRSTSGNIVKNSLSGLKQTNLRALKMKSLGSLTKDRAIGLLGKGNIVFQSRKDLHIIQLNGIKESSYRCVDLKDALKIINPKRKVKLESFKANKFVSKGSKTVVCNSRKVILELWSPTRTRS